MTDPELDIEVFLKEGFAESVSNLQDVRARLVAEHAQVLARSDEIKEGLKRIDKLIAVAFPTGTGTRKKSGKQYTPPEWRIEQVVKLLREEGPLRTRNVAQRLGWSQATASHVLTHARKRELIRVSGYAPGVKGKAPVFAAMGEE